MDDLENIRLDLEGVRALIQWKAQFAEEVTKQAIRLALRSTEPMLVTLRHYQEAVPLALTTLSMKIQNEVLTSEHQQAA